MSTRQPQRLQREIGSQVAQADQKRPKQKPEDAMQGGAREHPTPPFPKQHRNKPGVESRLEPTPMYDSPFYRGSGKLQDKIAMITGWDSGIGRAVAIFFACERAESLARHLVPRGTRVFAVVPGPVWTPLNPSDKAAKDVSKFGSDVPMKRPAQPEEIAPAYVFLASPQCSSLTTGEIPPVTGGYSGG